MEDNNQVVSRLVSVDPESGIHRCYICGSPDGSAADSKFSGGFGKYYSLFLHKDCLLDQGTIPSTYK